MRPSTARAAAENERSRRRHRVHATSLPGTGRGRVSADRENSATSTGLENMRLPPCQWGVRPITEGRGPDMRVPENRTFRAAAARCFRFDNHCWQTGMTPFIIMENSPNTMNYFQIFPSGGRPENLTNQAEMDIITQKFKCVVNDLSGAAFMRAGKLICETSTFISALYQSYRLRNHGI